MAENKKIRSNPSYVIVNEEVDNQRLDNFLINHLKGVPKTRIYRLIRKGEVRVNKKRIDVSYRLQKGDVVRLPPLYLAARANVAPPSDATISLLKSRILFETEKILILNKPCGMSVHAGSTVRMGVIEALRYMYPKFPNIELAHRLDSETSGCLIIAKRKSILREIHNLLREGKVVKKYWALTKGKWRQDQLKVNLPLHKSYKDGGKHVVSVHDQGKEALTYFHPINVFKNATLVEVKLMTGRTHQIRVHSAVVGHPIAGDDRYGDAEFNKETRRIGLKRMFLHARSIEFTLPSLNQHIKVEAPLDPELEKYITMLS